MKKRMLALLLALVMLASLLTMPIAAATPATIYKYFMNRAKTYGSASNGDYMYYYYINEDQSLAYGVFWDHTRKQVELCLFSSDFFVSLFLPSTGKTPYTGYIEVGSSARANFTVKPASYTSTTKLTLSPYEGDTSIKSNVADLAREALNLILEFSLVEMWDAGYRLKDLGFTKYTTHQVHYYGNGVVTTKPTCVSSGVMTYTCKICRDKITDTIAPTGVHTWKLVDIFDPGFEDETGYVHHGFASYACKYCSATKNADLCAEVIFTDMPARDNYAHNPIDWAYFGGITAGTSDTTFSPNKGCTRAQVVTFLWRAAGEPAPQQTDNPFTDVKAGQYYYDAVLWAVENGISLGTSSTTFSPDKTCTRAQIVTFLWRFEACPEAVNTVNPFRDVTGADYFYSAVLWAAETGVTTGTSDYEFSPAKTCTRAQVVTFLYRDSRLAPAESEEPQEPEDPVDPSEDELEPLGLPLPEEDPAEAAAEPKADEAEPEEAEAAGEAGELTTSAAAFTLSRTRSIDPPTELRPLASADLQALLELLEALKP